MNKTANRIITTFGVDFVVAASLISLTFLFATTLVTDTASAASLTITSSGAQSIDISGAGGAVISSDSINVATTCKSGYNFTINTSVNDNNLYLGGDASQNESGKYFTPADGTTTLANSTNTWGYYYNATSPSTVPTSSNIFSPVPTLNNPATVISPRATPSSTDINDNFNIYYGVSVSPTMPVGTYKMIPEQKTVEGTEILVDGTIVYTATISEDCMKYTVHFDPTSTSTGSTLTGTGTMDDQKIFEGTSTALNGYGYSPPSVYYKFAGWNTARDGSGTAYYNKQEVMDLASVGDTITLYAQWTECPDGKICYRPNANDVTGGMIESINAYPLSGYNFARPGYGFAGWSTNQTATGEIYGPNETVPEIGSHLEHNPGGYDLYAQWVERADEMQNWTGCSEMTIGDITALEDNRDGNVYTVAKLADGKCWMVENLRLDDSSELTMSNTNNPSLPLINDPTNSITSNYLSPSTAINSLCEADASGASCTDQSLLNNDNTTIYEDSLIPDEGSQELLPWDFIKRPLYGYGNYYNWYSATAGHGTYDTAYTESGWERMSVNTEGDLCPAGWRLPTETIGSTDLKIGDFSTLIDSLGDVSKLVEYPNNYVFNGIKDWSTLDVQFEYKGSNMYYWTATSNPWSNVNAMALEFNGSLNTESKAHGLGVRCVADQ